MVAVSLLLFLLFSFSLGHKDPPVVDPTNTVLDPCQCETRTFYEDEMSGTLKFIHNCTNSCTYEYYINPRAGYIVSLEDRDVGIFMYHGQFKSYYYTGETNEMDMITMGYGEAVPKGTDSPPGIGIYIRYQRPKDLSYYDVEFSFERIPVGELKKACPPPVLNVTSTIQTISTADWPSRGCTLRVQAEHPVTVKGDMLMMHKVAFQHKGDKFKLFPKITAAAQASYTLQSGTDILYRTRLGAETPTNLSFVALDYDPCNRTTTNLSIEIGQRITVKSDAEFAMFCSTSMYTYTVNLAKRENDDNVTTFIVETLLRPMAHFNLRIDDESVEMDNLLFEKHLNILTGETLQIHYYIYGNLVETGFSMNIAAVTQPHDCRCPSHSPKTFSAEESSFEMTIPPYCTHMMCQFALYAPGANRYWSSPDKILHLKADFQLHQDSLFIVGKEERRLFTGAMSPGHKVDSYSGDFMSNKSMVMVVYMRHSALEGMNDIVNETSHWKMNWHWITSNECSCGKTSFTASNKWTAIYSPRYPEEYCTNLNCTYNVEAPEGHHIQFWLHPIEIETEPHRDILSIFEGNKTLLQFSGHQQDHTIATTTEGQKAVVTFYSDNTVVAKGFKLNYLAIPDVDYVPKAVSGGYLQGFAIVGAILLLAVLIAMGIFLVYKRNLRRAIPPVYSFLPKSDEIVVIDVVDKE